MAKKNTSGSSGKGILIAVIVILLLILVSVIRKHPLIGIVLLLVVLSAVALFVFFSIKKKKPTASVASDTPSIPDPDICTKEVDYVPTIYDRYIVAYRYSENLYIPDDVDASLLRGQNGKALSFVFEPENEYDPNAVAVFLQDKNEKIGYVYKGKIQDMLHDWNDRDEPVGACLSTYSVPERKATYKIGFYKPLEKYEHKVFPITKIHKKAGEYDFESRYDAIQSCDPGDELTIEESFENDSFIVSNTSGSEIGELSASASKFVRENADDILGFVLESLDMDYDDKVTAKIAIYYKA